MTMTEDVTVSRAEFEGLQQEIADLKTQIQALLAASKKSAEPKISEDLITVIAAAVAAYIGKKATIRFIRRVADETAVWQEYGRTSISGSHALPQVRGW